MDGVWTSCFLSNCILVHCESQRAKMGKRIRMRNKNVRNEKKNVDIHTENEREKPDIFANSHQEQSVVIQARHKISRSREMRRIQRAAHTALQLVSRKRAP